MEIEFLNGCEHSEEIAPLFAEYTAMLVAGDPRFQAYLDLQNYYDELKNPEHKYGLPGGRLYLVRANGEAAACIALRRMDAERCEMKRLYVRPAFRGNGIAGRLVRRVTEDARAVGYRAMLLDTLPFLTDAIRLYRGLGFYEIPCYNDNPLDDSIYLQLDL